MKALLREHRQRRPSILWHIELGDAVIDRHDGRVGVVVMPGREPFVRFEDGQHAVKYNSDMRPRLIPVEIAQAFAEIDAEDAAEVAYDEMAARAYLEELR